MEETVKEKALNQLFADLISPFVNRPGENDRRKFTIIYKKTKIRKWKQ